MIEKLVLDYLSDYFNIKVTLQKPEAMPDELILVEKVGGYEDDHIYSATLAIQSYAPTLYGASVLNEAVKMAMATITSLETITRCKLNSDYNFSDTRTKEYRYQAVFDITHY